jgi:hypothetical protein
MKKDTILRGSRFLCMLLSENTFYRDYEEAYSTTQGRDSFSCYCYRTHSVKNTFFVKYIYDQHKHKKK